MPRKTVFGHVADPPVAAARRRLGARRRRPPPTLRTLRLARFGDNMRDVAVTEGDKVEAELTLRRLGQRLRRQRAGRRRSSGPEEAVDALVTEYQDLYDVAAELRPGGERHESLRYGARIEAGLRRFLTDGGFGAFTTNFEDLGALRQLPGLAVQRLMADGYGFGGEGDWKTSVLLRALKAAATGLPGGTSFMEDYTYHLEPGASWSSARTCWRSAPRSPRGRPKLEIHPLSIGGREDPVRLVFDAAPGPAVVVGLADLGDRFRLVANEIDTVAPPEPLPNLPVARAVWAPRPDLRTSAEAWLIAGAPHHTVYSSALGTEVLRDLAEIVGVELLVIDADTQVRQFARELRWNQAYYRLARGF